MAWWKVAAFWSLCAFAAAGLVASLPDVFPDWMLVAMWPIYLIPATYVAAKGEPAFDSEAEVDR